MIRQDCSSTISLAACLLVALRPRVARCERGRRRAWYRAGGAPGTGGATGSGGGGAAGVDAKNPTLLCPPDSSTCTQAEWGAYSTCVANACDSQYRVCLGASYRSGVFAGACQPWAQCLAACGCGNPGCRSTCPAQTAECATCYAGASGCLLTCTIPSCAFTAADAGTPGDARTPGDAAAADSGTGAGCAGLMSCCNSIADPGQRADCADSYDMIVSFGERACDQLHEEFRVIGYCS